MAEYLEMPCPQCAHPLRVHQQYFGKRLACKYCKHTFKVAGAAPAPPPSADTGELRSKIAALEEQLRESQTKLDAAEGARQIAEGERQRVQEELGQALAQLHGLQVEQEHNERALIDAASIQPQLQAAQVECQRLQADIESVRSASERELADARSECQRLQTELESIRSISERELAAARSECQRRETELNVFRSASDSELAAARSETAKVTVELTEVRSELDATVLARDRAEALAEKLHLARAEASAAATRQQNESQTTAEKLRAEIAAGKQLLADAAAVLEDARKQWETERATLQTNWETEREEQARAWQETAQAAEQRFEEERRALVQKNDEAIASLAAQLDQLATRREELEQSLRQSKQESAQEVEALRNQVVTLEQREQEANARLDELQRELEAGKAAPTETRQASASNGEADKRKQLEDELARCRYELSMLQQTCRSYGLDFSG